MTPRTASHLKTTVTEDHAGARLLPSHAEHADSANAEGSFVAAVSEAGVGRWTVTVNGSSTLAGETECSKNKSDYVPIPRRCCSC